MGVYTRKDSPYYWLHIPTGRGRPPVRESTDPPVDVDAPTAIERKALRELAEAQYRTRARDVAAGKTRRDLIRGFTPWVDWWRDQVSVHRRGHEREREILARWRRDLADVPDLRDLTVTRIQEWMTTRRAQVSASTVNREIDVLKQVLRDAVTHQYLEASPIEGMPRLRITKPKRRLLTPDEETRLLAVLAPDDRAIFLIGLDALVRFTDILELRRTDDHGTHLYVADPKNGEPLPVPVSQRLRAALDSLPVNGVYLFARRRGAATERDRRGAYRQALQRACRKADVPYGRAVEGITFHWSTRRTGATRLIRGGEDLTTVQVLGGWKRAATLLEIYSEVDPSKVAAAVEKIGGTNGVTTRCTP